MKNREFSLPFDLETHFHNLKFQTNLQFKMSDWANDDLGSEIYDPKESGDKRTSRRYDYQNKIDLRMDSIARIIGRGGSNIKQLESNFNVRIELDNLRGTVTVLGNKNSDVEDALVRIKDQMNDSATRGGGNESHSKINYDYDKPSTSRQYSDYDHNKNKKHDFVRERQEAFGVEKENNVGDAGLIDWDALNQKAEIERKKRWEKCPPLRKDFYEEDPHVANMSSVDAAAIRSNNNNTTVRRVFAQTDENIPNPILKFGQCFSKYPDLMTEIKKKHFKQPSPIQAQAWPILLKGEDMIGIAQTGTGKTLAFLLPAMIHTEYQTTPRSKRGGPNVLILAPTRELALQIEKEVNKYPFRGMKAVCIYGGGNRREQIGSMEKGAEIIICTPGRLNDLIQANVINIASVTYLVLDEADRMLDMGFEPQIRKILLDIRPDRQTVMTSATWPAQVRRLAESYMNNPIQVCVGSLDLAATHTVKQIIEILEEEHKFQTVMNFIKHMHRDEKAIIFCGKKVRADDLSSEITLKGYHCQCIHGSRDQSDREQAIADITSGRVNILIATDIASRGLDIEDITHVINYDFPRSIEEYVHRVGRTGRAGRTGTSISYITRSNWSMAAELIGIMEEAGQRIPSELRKMSERFGVAKKRRAEESHKLDRMKSGRGHDGGGSMYGNRKGGGRQNRY